MFENQGTRFGNRKLKIGILAVQGDFEAHAAMLERLGAETAEVRTAAQLEGCDGLILPGGESTTQLQFLREEGLADAIEKFAKEGGAIFGTCAGAILLATEVRQRHRHRPHEIEEGTAGDGFHSWSDHRAGWARLASSCGIRTEAGAGATGSDYGGDVSSGIDGRFNHPSALPRIGRGRACATQSQLSKSLRDRLSSSGYLRMLRSIARIPTNQRMERLRVLLVCMTFRAFSRGLHEGRVGLVRFDARAGTLNQKRA